jgi:hypothetical protein
MEDAVGRLPVGAALAGYHRRKPEIEALEKELQAIE